MSGSMGSLCAGVNWQKADATQLKLSPQIDAKEIKKSLFCDFNSDFFCFPSEDKDFGIRFVY